MLNAYQGCGWRWETPGDLIDLRGVYAPSGLTPRWREARRPRASGRARDGWEAWGSLDSAMSRGYLTVNLNVKVSLERGA
jgi:hypothetical protein